MISGGIREDKAGEEFNINVGHKDTKAKMGCLNI